MTKETMGDVMEQLGRAIHALNPALMPVLMDTSESAKLNSDYERVTLLFSKLRHLSRPAPSEASEQFAENANCSEASGDVMEVAATFAFEQRDDEKPAGWNEACDHIANAFRYEANPLGKNITATPAPQADVWRPIAEICLHPETGCPIEDTIREDALFIVKVPELLDPDFNPSGMAQAHWQDGGVTGETEPGSFVAPKWCNHHDEYHLIDVTPTHFMFVRTLTESQTDAD